MKIVLDTNILVNVLLSPSRNSASFRILELCLERKLEPQVGAALFAEYEDVLSRQSIVEKSVYSKTEIDIILDGFLDVCTWNKVHFLWRPNLKDEDDNHLIDLAVASNSKFIITQNLKDLISGDLLFGFEVVSPREFLKQEH